jgi:hypothetical protein
MIVSSRDETSEVYLQVETEWNVCHKMTIYVMGTRIRKDGLLNDN